MFFVVVNVEQKVDKMKNNKLMKKIGIFSIFAVLFLFVSCKHQTANNEPPEEASLIVAVTIVPQETFVNAVCGDLVEVVTMVPPGNSPANYEPTPEQMVKFSDASVYFSIGVPTEAVNILPSAEAVKVVSLQKSVSKVYPDRKFDNGVRDPHIWLSPKRVEVIINTIASEMSALDPEHQQIYMDNAKEYVNRLQEIDLTLTEIFAELENNKFMVYHPSFGYLASDYGLEMYTLEFDGKEATAKQLQSMIDLAREENIKVLFYQAEIDSSQSQAFAEEIGGQTIQLSPLAPNYIENLESMALRLAEGIS